MDELINSPKDVEHLYEKRIIVHQLGSEEDVATLFNNLRKEIVRAVHGSVYDKNLDEQVHPTVVPDDVIKPQSDKYWAPHPQTGVFGPATEQNRAAGFHSTVNGGEDSVLEQKAFFRPLEDLDKPSQP
ncbi:hypothetical protein TEA_004774 [Camellia sinensis var. sinensis]|uniref:Uncharacterized protein n=1 Tax=Camellia sinensis var. sinensis TaxID=542762 RepID=A0A4S4DNV7_CAMSN|nr:hypothetical protein TEA_004774 [Camellia sinensis var. sinensis]